MSPAEQTPTTGFSLLGQLEEADRQLRRFRSASEDTTGTAQSADGLVEATVGLYGEIRELVLDPRVYRDPDADVLAGQIRDVVNDAVRDAQKAAVAQLSSLLPPGTEDPADLAFEPFLTEIANARKAGRR
jgi:DNA-binding protein YbaB